MCQCCSSLRGAAGRLLVQVGLAPLTGAVCWPQPGNEQRAVKMKGIRVCMVGLKLEKISSEAR